MEKKIGEIISKDWWAVIIASVIALLVKFGVITNIPW